MIATYATMPSQSRGRRFNSEKQHIAINEFQEDILRISRATSFRRLANKTQVFINSEPKSDHHRSRLTHTLEVSTISKMIADALHLSSDLTEAICLTHDMGHPPFGHAGEDVLNKLLSNHGGFNHNHYAFKLVTEIEEKYIGYNGLNLTWETLEGIVKHNGPLTTDIPNFIADYNKKHNLRLDKFPSLEAQVASIADDISYSTHDLEDGLRAGLFSLESLIQNQIQLPNRITKFVKRTNEKRMIHEMMLELIYFLIEDVITNSKKNINKFKIKTLEDVQNHNGMIISLSDKGNSVLNSLKGFLKRNVYENKDLLRECNRCMWLLEDLYKVYLKDPELLPEQWNRKISNTINLPILIGDYIAGMTDSFIIKEHKRLCKSYFPQMS